jgi:hypothetical protein
MTQKVGCLITAIKHKSIWLQLYFPIIQENSFASANANDNLALIIRMLQIFSSTAKSYTQAILYKGTHFYSVCQMDLTRDLGAPLKHYFQDSQQQ